MYIFMQNLANLWYIRMLLSMYRILGHIHSMLGPIFKKLGKSFGIQKSLSFLYSNLFVLPVHGWKL